MDDEIKQIDNQLPQFGALRFSANVIIGIGWVVILFGIALTLYVYDPITAPLIENYLPDDITINSQNFISVLFLFGQWLFVFTVGMFIVASGQVFLVLLGIYEHARALREYTRLNLER